MKSFLTYIIIIGIIYVILEKNSAIIPFLKEYFYNTQTTSPVSSKDPKQENQTDSQNNQEQHKQESTQAIDIEGNFIEKSISKVMVNVLKTEEGKKFINNIVKPEPNFRGDNNSFKVGYFNNIIDSMFDIRTFDKGEKGPAMCGHYVTVNYHLLSENNVTIKTGTQSWTLGEDIITPGLDAIIVGMKTGQTRQAMLKAQYLKELGLIREISSVNGIVKAHIVLKTILPENFIDPTNMRIFDDEISYQMPLLCGNKAKFDAKIIKLSDNSVIYDSKKSGKNLSIKIGEPNYPVIFAHSLHGKIPVGTRSIITQGKWLKSFTSKNSTIFPKVTFPEHDYYLIDLYNFK